MGNFWTRRTTPSMQPNRLLISSMAGSPRARRTLTPSRSSPNSGVNWLSYVSSLETQRVNQHLRVSRVLQLPVLCLHLSMQLFFGILKVQHLHHRVLTLPLYWSPAPQSTRGLSKTNQHLSQSELSTNG